MSKELNEQTKIEIPRPKYSQSISKLSKLVKEHYNAKEELSNTQNEWWVQGARKNQKFYVGPNNEVRNLGIPYHEVNPEEFQKSYNKAFKEFLLEKYHRVFRLPFGMFLLIKKKTPPKGRNLS